MEAAQGIGPITPSSERQYSIVGEPINPTQDRSAEVDTRHPVGRRPDSVLYEVGNALGVRGFIFAGLVVAGIVFAVWSNMPDSPPPAYPVEQGESQQRDSVIPPIQKSFTSMIESFIPVYNAADTEIRKTNVRFERKHSILQYFAGSGSLRFQGWVGEVSKLTTESDGEAYVSIKLRGAKTVIETWNNSFSDSSPKTMISRSDAIYPSLMDIKEGNEVTVSGAFIADGVGQDYVREASLTEDGAMTSPEFIVRFSQITKGNGRTSIPVPSGRTTNVSQPGDVAPVADGRIYSVALIDANTQRLARGTKLFVQGTVLAFSSGTIVLQDERTTAKLGCVMESDLYEAARRDFATGNPVKVFGEYVGIAPEDPVLQGVTLFRNCTVAPPTDDVVRADLGGTQ